MRGFTNVYCGAVLVLTFVTSPVVAAQCDLCVEARALWNDGACDSALPLLKKATKKHKDSVDAFSLQSACFATLDKRRGMPKALAGFWALNPSNDQIQWLRGAVEGSPAETSKVRIQFDLPSSAIEPIPLVSSRPVPSPEASAFRVGGDVVVEGVLQTDGTLSEMEVLRLGDWSGPHAFGFGESAMSSLSGYRYFPALDQGQPIPVRFRAIVRIGPE